MNHDLLRDEQGKGSMFRALLVAQLVWVDIAGLLDGIYGDGFSFPGEWWVIQGGLLLALIAGAGGPRIAQYVAPQIGRTAQAVAKAVRAKAREKWPDQPTRPEDK